MIRLTAASLMLTAAAALADSSVPIDRTVTATRDLRREKSGERISLQLSASSLASAVNWTLTIQASTGEQLLRIEHSDADIDKFFADPGFVDKCTDYRSCKSRYYFDLLPASITALGTPAQAAWLTEAFFEQNLEETARPFLAGEHLPPQQVELALAEMKNTLSHPGFRSLNLPLSPVRGNPPRIWVEAAHKFVPYYQE